MQKNLISILEIQRELQQQRQLQQQNRQLLEVQKQQMQLLDVVRRRRKNASTSLILNVAQNIVSEFVCNPDD